MPVEPSQLRVGDTWSWRRSLPDYPASKGWVLTYELVNGSDCISIAATADGDDHLVVVPAVDTSNKAAGDYQWLARVRKAGVVTSIESGVMTVLPDFSRAVDARSHVRKVLAAIERILEGRATKDDQEYSIGGRSLKRTPIPDLLLLRDKYKIDLANEIAAENLQKGLGTGKRILVRFR